jgi:hypothetical protein
MPMDNRQAAAVGILFGVGALAVGSVVLSIPMAARYVIGVIGVICILTSIAALVWPSWFFKPTQINELAPLKIIFDDKQNPDGKFWSLELVKDDAGKAKQPITHFWEYRVAIKNASLKTVRNVSVTTDWVDRIPGLTSVPYDQLFKRTKTKTVDLKPQCEELIPVLTWPHPRIQPGMLAGESILGYGKLKVLASGDDVPPTERYFKFNYERDPMLFNWVERS